MQDPLHRFEAITVGTGSSTVRLDRSGPCTLLTCGETRAAVDLGTGALRGLLRAGVRPGELDALFFTHLHPDHVADLVALLFSANYGEPPRGKPLMIVGGAGTSTYLDALRAAHSHWLDPKGYELEVREVSSGHELIAGTLHVRAGAASHIASSVAFRFFHRDRSLVLSGDTGESAEFEAFAEGADVLILEASQPEGFPAPGHLTPGQAGALARRARVRRLVLNHFTLASDASDPGVAAAQVFGRSVVVARDGRRIRV